MPSPSKIQKAIGAMVGSGMPMMGGAPPTQAPVAPPPPPLKPKKGKPGKGKNFSFNA